MKILVLIVYHLTADKVITIIYEIFIAWNLLYLQGKSKFVKMMNLFLSLFKLLMLCFFYFILLSIAAEESQFDSLSKQIESAVSTKNTEELTKIYNNLIENNKFLQKEIKFVIQKIDTPGKEFKNCNTANPDKITSCNSVVSFKISLLNGAEINKVIVNGKYLSFEIQLEKNGKPWAIVAVDNDGSLQESISNNFYIKVQFDETHNFIDSFEFQ